MIKVWRLHGSLLSPEITSSLVGEADRCESNVVILAETRVPNANMHYSTVRDWSGTIGHPARCSTGSFRIPV